MNCSAIHGRYSSTALHSFYCHKSDLWILGAYASEQEIAIYGAAVRLVMLAAMSLAMVNMVVPPIIASMHAQNDLTGWTEKKTASYWQLVLRCTFVSSQVGMAS
ncbi:MAG TPA: hypothetical protein ENI88_02065 [Desulfobulbus sp.]|nr:hypothetical protein [Desulfobulbus sp.]